MLRILTRRIGEAIVVVFGVVLISFIMARKIPGDAAVNATGPRATKEQLDAARERLGIDQPIPVQLWHYFSDLFHGDLGMSLSTRQPVAQDLGRALPASLELVTVSMVIAVAVGIPLGILAARWNRRTADVSIRFSSVLMISMPVFLFALIAQLVFATRLQWFPAAGEYSGALARTQPVADLTNFTIIDSFMTGNWSVFGSSLHHLVLPAIVLAAYPTGVVIQMVRASLLEETSQDHTLMERALGFSRLAVLIRFSLRPAFGPILSLLALVFAYALVNSFLVEAVFNWPGLGSYTTNAIRSLDAPAIAGVTLTVALVYVVLNLLVDLVQSMIDPRMRAA